MTIFSKYFLTELNINDDLKKIHPVYFLESFNSVSILGLRNSKVGLTLFGDLRYQLS